MDKGYFSLGMCLSAIIASTQPCLAERGDYVGGHIEGRTNIQVGEVVQYSAIDKYGNLQFLDEADSYESLWTCISFNRHEGGYKKVEDADSNANTQSFVFTKPGEYRVWRNAVFPENRELFVVDVEGRSE